VTTTEEKRARKRAKNASLPLGTRTTEIEIYGAPGVPRMRWSCKQCAARNDSAIRVPLLENKTGFGCFRCRAFSTFTFTFIEGEPDGMRRTVTEPTR
jgi:hypothetical protein